MTGVIRTKSAGSTRVFAEAVVDRANRSAAQLTVFAP
jgi:hypothetical protein